MIEEIKKEVKTTEEKKEVRTGNAAPTTANNAPRGGRQQQQRRGGGPRKDLRKNKRGGRPEGEADELQQRMVDIARVTRVMAGGKRMRFRACVVVGNRAGKVGYGVAKGADVTLAVTKAVNKAKKDLIIVPIINDTIPHEVFCKTGAAKILFKPAKQGRGVIAGGAVRIVLEIAGIKNITSKILGTNNKLNNVQCTIEALKQLKKVNVPVKKVEKKVEVAPEAAAVAPAKEKVASAKPKKVREVKDVKSKEVKK